MFRGLLYLRRFHQRRRIRGNNVKNGLVSTKTAKSVETIGFCVINKWFYMFRSFTDAERRFNEAGTMFHLSTEPIEDAVVFATEAEFITANNLIALAISCSNCIILAMAIMSNHLHFVLEGTREDCLAFFEDLRFRLQKVFVRGGKGGIIARMNPGLVPINDLSQLQDEIAYVIRNPFVTRTDVNLLGYKWCSGFL